MEFLLWLSCFRSPQDSGSIDVRVNYKKTPLFHIVTFPNGVPGAAQYLVHKLETINVTCVTSIAWIKMIRHVTGQTVWANARILQK